MKRNDATFNTMISRLQAGEFSREQAAAEYGISRGTLNVWISRSGLADTIPSLQGKSMAGAAAAWTPLTADKVNATEAAVARVLSGEISALAASKLDPNVSARTLAKRVRQARIAKGHPVPFRTAPSRTTPAPMSESEKSRRANDEAARALEACIGALGAAAGALT